MRSILAVVLARCLAPYVFAPWLLVDQRDALLDYDPTFHEWRAEAVHWVPANPIFACLAAIVVLACIAFWAIERGLDAHAASRASQGDLYGVGVWIPADSFRFLVENIPQADHSP